ncbi:acyltransferase [Cryobacterium sp. PH31-O1]|uniref:acyltransferase n=1 Tax=Cryobacterium sp. PH31-O1 TaxID=3046306 RepID=UPI0024BA1970|nr:acyltransferase [Cryobacterium sp. PH31-O1]MDJ0338354.1 acyltransferase [Cryobacterium sp. PH31-O1]
MTIVPSKEVQMNIAKLTRLAFSEFRPSVWRTFRALPYQGRCVVGQRFRLVGGNNIRATRNARIKLGVGYYGFVDSRVGGLLRIGGRLEVNGTVSVASGNRWDIGQNSTMAVGDGTHFSPFVLIITSIGLTVGKNCAIGWNVQILDDDFHSLSVNGTLPGPTSKAIQIGNRVWIGSHAKIFKGVQIANGCVVAGNATVTRSFSEENCLIAGSPATVIRRNVAWH